MPPNECDKPHDEKSALPIDFKEPGKGHYAADASAAGHREASPRLAAVSVIIRCGRSAADSKRSGSGTRNRRFNLFAGCKAWTRCTAGLCQPALPQMASVGRPSMINERPAEDDLGAQRPLALEDGTGNQTAIEAIIADAGRRSRVRRDPGQ